MTGFILGLVTGAWLFGITCFLIGRRIGERYVEALVRVRIQEMANEAYGDMPTMSHRMRGHPSSETYRLKS